MKDVKQSASWRICGSGEYLHLYKDDVNDVWFVYRKNNKNSGRSACVSGTLATCMEWIEQ